MEFGATQCKPRNPYCIVCPLKDGCQALIDGKVDTLPVKLKKTKVTKKYINFLVLISNDKQTVFEKRTSKGIWQNLYQFPLIESTSPLAIENFTSHEGIKNFFKGVPFEYSLFNTTDIVHKLSHQHLHTRFWIIEIEQLPIEGIPIQSINKYPAPVLISNFIEEFGF